MSPSKSVFPIVLWLSFSSLFQLSASDRFAAEMIMDGTFFQIHEVGAPYQDFGYERYFNGRGILQTSVKINSSLSLFYEGRYNQLEPLNHGDVLKGHGYGYPVLQGFLRYSTKLPSNLTFQFGKFGSPFGHFLSEDYPNINPLITAPLIYTYPLTIHPDRIPANAYDLVRWQYYNTTPPALYAHDYDGVPIVNYPYPTGILAYGDWAKFDYRLALVNSSLSNPLNIGNSGQHPQWVAGAGYSPFPGLRIGTSLARGPYLNPSVQSSLPPGTSIESFSQGSLGFDLQYSIGHLEIQSELVFNSFEVPNIYKSLGTTGYYVQAKQTLTPRIYLAARWDQLISDQITTQYYGYYDSSYRYANNVDSLEIALGLRITEKMLLKSSYQYRRTDGVYSYYENNIGMQLVYSFDVKRLLRIP
ncbi:MAG: hypothetical protein U0V70_11635 [Terriglobia bacterium]